MSGMKRRVHDAIGSMDLPTPKPKQAYTPVAPRAAGFAPGKKKKPAAKARSEYSFTPDRVG
jgi:hypothetical protein